MDHGSFTGLRIGISTIKAFSDVTGLPIVGISSLESLAYNIKKEGLIVSLIDAKNDNVYFSLFNLNNGIYSKKEDFSCSNINDISNVLKRYSQENITFVGDGSVIHRDILEANFSFSTFASEDENMQNSVSIGLAALDKYKAGFSQNSNTLLPLYLRKSQAERALDGEK